MDLRSFLEGPMLWLSLLVLASGLILRIAFFIRTALRNDIIHGPAGKSLSSVVARSLLPLHKAVETKPCYSLLRYVFHLCLVFVPVFLAGHVILWKESGFGWDSAMLPDPWADVMTLTVLALAAVFLVRRITRPEARQGSFSLDYVLIVMTALPFLTGYLSMHGHLNPIPFLRENILTIHILSGEVLLVLVAFLLVGTRFNDEKCIGCGACELSCPTGTIESADGAKARTFSISYYRCIGCGACTITCPENAVELRHNIGIRHLSRPFSKEVLTSIEFVLCRGCNAPVGPKPQLDEVARTFTDDYVHLCTMCKKASIAAHLHQLATTTTPRTHQTK